MPAIAGPFDLGNVVMRREGRGRPAYRAADDLERSGCAEPIIEQGIPLDIRTLSLNIDRPGLILNPTGCAPQTVAGTIASAGGTSAAVSSPFQAVNCAQEPFKPTLTALTHAQTSRADGAYLQVKIVSGPGQANIAKVKVDLPKQLPSRLKTLQKACDATVFEADPAACPAASIVGSGDGGYADARGRAQRTRLPGVARWRCVPGARDRPAGRRDRDRAGRSD